MDANKTCTATFNLTPPSVSATKEDSDPNGSPYKPDDLIQYTVVLSNSGGQALSDTAGDEFTDTITAAGVLPNHAPTASSGTISYNATTRTYSWNGAIPAGSSVTLSFQVKISKGVANGTRICNQGSVKNGTGGTVLTTDPTPLSGAGTQTCIEVSGGRPEGIMCGVRCLLLSTSDLKSQPIAIQIFSLNGRQLYASGWMSAGNARQVEQIEQRLANGVYLYLIQVKDADGKVQTQLKKLIIQR